jgi:hypothetical protein
MKKICMDILTTGRYLYLNALSVKINGPGVRSMKRREAVCMSHYDRPEKV